MSDIPTHENLVTPWQPDEPVPLPEYPRPQMARANWQNLNGWWHYAVTDSDGTQPGEYEGQILVPFAIESRLSGVERALLPGETLWYTREFNQPLQEGERLLLHFGAVDFACQVYVNDVLAGEHWGGYLPFTFDITGAVHAGQNRLVVGVQDPTDAALHQKGKQRLNPGGIWYQAVSGIWQTVWLEVVPERYIQEIRLTPDLDAETLRLEFVLSEHALKAGCQLEAAVSFNGSEVASGTAAAGSAMLLSIPEPHTWHPDHPHLYDLELRLTCAGELVDRVESYFAMRKFGKARDADGLVRFTLNNEPIFLYGPLDQGYFPDGLYTPPSEAAMLFDIEYTQRIGCNMIRKHVKVEPLRWYHACDKLGMIVMQDMPNGGRTTKDAVVYFTFTSGIHRFDQRRLKRFGREEADNRAEFEVELEEMIHALYNCPCISSWVPFNESWGQFDALRVAENVKRLDPTRLVDHASGWFDQGGGDYQSRHVYVKPLSASQPDDRVLAVTEFGGYSLKIPGHVWNEDKKFGYRHFKTSEDLTRAYVQLLREQVLPLISRGLSMAIYTQTTDVETEINGYLTYDRKVEKMDAELLREIHTELISTIIR